MAEWFATACALLDPGRASALTLACALVAVLLVASVVAGFLWLRSRSTDGADDDGGLLATWRLYRQLGRAAAGRR